MTSTHTAETQARYAAATYVASYRAEEQAQVRICDCCGQGLWNINVVRLADGTQVALGNDCVERVGLDLPGLKAWWAQKFAEERRLAQQARWAVADAENRARVNGLPQRDELIAYYQAAQAEHERRGGTGDVTGRPRDFDGIFADFDCDAVETGRKLAHDLHVTAWRVEGAADNMRAFVRRPFRGVISTYKLGRASALFGLDGNLLDARYVEGNYGWVWRVALPGGGVDWFNPSRARNPEVARRNNAKKGYYVGRVLTLADHDRNGRFYTRSDVPPVVILDNGLLPYDGWD